MDSYGVAAVDEPSSTLQPPSNYVSITGDSPPQPKNCPSTMTSLSYKLQQKAYLGGGTEDGRHKNCNSFSNTETSSTNNSHFLNSLEGGVSNFKSVNSGSSSRIIFQPNNFFSTENDSKSKDDHE